MPHDPDEFEDESFRSVLASVDRQGKRRRLAVRIIGGSWRKRRQVLAVVLVLFYLGAPFVSINGAPLIQIDIAARRFWLFGQVFWPQDFFYFLLFFLTFIVTTIAAVATLGRVFCGWLCPHNVFLELVYRPLERLILGPAERRARLNQQRSPGERQLRSLLKTVVFLAVSAVLANAATALFVGTSGFISVFGWPIIVNPVDHPAAAVFFVIFMTACMLDFALLREQVCTVVCPYGRLQSAMLDRESLQVLYHEQRGEPRGKKGKVEGDCVDCGMCVQVCPTGIDIRNGVQLECINCMACIDACNSVMSKLKREPNLIRFSSESADQDGRRHRILRPRSALYALVLVVLLSATTIALSLREPVRVKRLRAATAEATVDGTGRAVLDQPVSFAILNQSAQPIEVRFALAGTAEAQVLPSKTWPVASDARLQDELNVVVPAAAFDGLRLETELVATWRDHNGTEREQRLPVTLRRPLSHTDGRHQP